MRWYIIFLSNSYFGTRTMRTISFFVLKVFFGSVSVLNFLHLFFFFSFQDAILFGFSKFDKKKNLYS